MGDRDNLLAMLQESRSELAAAVRGLPQDRMTVPWYGDWSTKDVMGHIASWDELTVADLNRIARGRLPCLAAFREADVNDWNAFLMRPRKLFPLPQIEAEFEECRAALLGMAKELPENFLAKGHMVRTILEVTVNHEKDHAGRLREWRQREGI